MLNNNDIPMSTDVGALKLMRLCIIDASANTSYEACVKKHCKTKQYSLS